jgi:RHS repeat-associated protein
MAARLTQLLVALALVLGTAFPSAAAAVIRPPTSQTTAASPVPDRGTDAANARSYFGARYYRAEIGRFTTVDPELNVNAALLDPQRWNRYTYARSNPLRWTDPDGRAIVCGSAACQEYARRMAELKREYQSASGFEKVWAGVKLALAAGEFMPTPFAIAAEGGAAAAAATRIGFAEGAYTSTALESGGTLIGGALRGGGTASVSFGMEGERLVAGVSFVAGPAGTLKTLEAGMIELARSEGATSLKMTATMVKDSMARLLRAQGFSPVIVDGKATGDWVKIISL